MRTIKNPIQFLTAWTEVISLPITIMFSLHNQSDKTVELLQHIHKGRGNLKSIGTT